MADHRNDVDEMRQAIKKHFDRSADVLTFEQLVDMSALGVEAAQNALRVLGNKGWIARWPDGNTNYLTYVTQYLGP